MSTDAGLHFNRRKRPRPADDLSRRRPHGPRRNPGFFLDAVPSCFLALPPEAGSAAFDMWNYLSSAFSGCMPRDGGLEVYRGLVAASQYPRDLTVATRDDVGTRLALSRRILDSRKAALHAVAPPRERRKPFYKDAHEKAGLHDKRLGELEVEVRLQDEILDEMRKPKEDLSHFFVPLTAEDEKRVHDCLYGSGSSSNVLVLHESSNIEISREKIRCLRPHGWLNDEVINLYLELLKERGIREPKRSFKCHFFNTFFYKKLACGKNGYDYKSVKRWTTLRKLGYKLIECDKNLLCRSLSLYIKMYIGV